MSDPVVVHQINHTLSCSYDGLPRPTVTWRFNESTFVTGSDNYVIRESDNMSHVDIVGSKLGNSGEYECEVSNLLGTDSDTVFLTVQGEGGSPGAHRGGVLQKCGQVVCRAVLMGPEQCHLCKAQISTSLTSSRD